jgi:hypothetical protein
LGGSDGAIGGVGTTLVSAVDRSYFTASPDQYTKNAPPSARQAVILSTGSSGPGPLVQPGAAFTVTGIQFRGGTEASGGGAAAANSSFSYPHLILQRVDSSGGGGPQSDSGFVVDLTTAIYANSGNLSTLDSSITVTIPATSASIPAGWYAARVGANDVYSNGFFVQSGPSKPLLPPTSATGTVLGVSSVSWTWSTVAGVDGYNVYQATSGVFLGTAPAVAVPTFVETGLESGAETSVKIAGFTLSGDGPAIMASSVTTVVIPQVGTVVGTALNTTSIVWNWLGGKGVLYYNVYNSTTGVVIATPTANTFTDSNLEVNSRRSIRVSAVVPGAEGPLSEGATAYTWANTPAPASPFLLSLSTGSYLVKWLINGNPNGTTYYVRIVGVDGSSATLTTQTLSAGITGFSPSVPLFPGSPYDTQIGAVNGDGIDTAPLDLGTTYTLTTTPTGLTVIDNTPVSLTVQWDTTANSTFTTYQVTYSSDNFVADISTALAFSAAFNGSQANIPGLRTSTTYWIRVQASNPFGQLSAFSGSISTITNNGGAASGSLAGPLLAAANSELAGYLSDGRYVQLDSPRGAFPTDTIATLTPFNVVAGSTLCPNGFNVAVTITMNPALQPVAPVYFTADYDPASIGVVPTSRITLARYVDIGVCTPLDTTFLAGSSRPQFRAQLNHFSTYQLVQIPLETSAANARIFPNPYRASRDGYVTFDSMPPYSRVRIMTLQGETLLDERANSYGLLTWGGTNGGGRVAASGLYIVVVESGGSKKIQKLAVIR